MKPKTVKAWAVRQSDGSLGPIAPTKMFDYEVPVRIVPESEYKRMMAAVKFVEAYLAWRHDKKRPFAEWDARHSANEYAITKIEQQIKSKAKGKVKRG